MSCDLAWLASALHALDAPPLGARPWNMGMLEDLLPAPSSLRQAAVLVGIVPREDHCGVLLTRRTEHLRHHAGQISFPGGALELHDADDADAALRETFEETGISPTQVELLGYLDPLATITGFRVQPVVGLVDVAYHPRPNPNEVAEVFELPLDFLLAPDSLFHAVMRHGPHERKIAEFHRWAPRPDLRVWGATAMILENLRQRLGEAEPMA